jgi:bifunctional DNA-binding transcriptional regulator/antitoxin component of YhaV-PrlF toxin-antitoxin module
MSKADDVGEGTVSGNQVSIPAHIRREFDIEDGDVIRWKIVDGELEVEVLNRREAAFEGFEPGESDGAVDGVERHDTFGVE